MNGQPAAEIALIEREADVKEVLDDGRVIVLSSNVAHVHAPLVGRLVVDRVGHENAEALELAVLGSNVRRVPLVVVHNTDVMHVYEYIRYGQTLLLAIHTFYTRR